VIFIDTAAFLARYLRRDQNHRSAYNAWQQLEAEKARLVTSNFVLDEFFTLLGRRTTYEYSAGRAQISWRPVGWRSGDRMRRSRSPLWVSSKSLLIKESASRIAHPLP